MNFSFKKEIAIFLVIFIAVTVFIYFLFTGGAYAQKLRYNIFFRFPILNELLESASKFEITAQENAGTRNPETKNYLLTIPKIKVSAPIVFAKENTSQSILTSLEEGVGLYPDSQIPGRQGRAVILGHSSRALWYKGNYAYVFSLLEKLEAGDEFYIESESGKYTYRVYDKKILSTVEANAVLAEIPKTSSEVGLITCWPVGGSLKRTLVLARMIEE